MVRGNSPRRIHGRLVQSGPTKGGELSVRFRGPFGPCAIVFPPWKHAGFLLASRKIGGALAAGCSAILKARGGKTPRRDCSGPFAVS